MKMKFGAIVTDGRGKIGGHVASKNRSGSYLRTKVTPVNPQSSAQSTVRSRFATLASAWSGLTDAQRLGWNSAVASFAKTDIFGDVRNPSGFNLFQRLNNNLFNISEAMITTAPLPESIPAVAMSAIVAEITPNLLTMAYDSGIGGVKVLVFATAPQSAGKTFVKSEYRQISVITPAASPVDLTTAYVAKFGNLGVVGQKIYVKAYAISEVTGQAGTPEQMGATVILHV